MLHAAGSSLTDAVKVQVFLADMDDYHAMNEVYDTFFTEPKPVRFSSELRIVLLFLTVFRPALALQ